MLTHFAHDIAAAYADATHADAATCADLAAFAAGLPLATLAHPFALARRLAAADFGEEAVPCAGFTRHALASDDRADAMRSILAPVSRDAARFARMQLPLPLPCPFGLEVTA